MPTPQTYKNHGRFHPPFHFFVAPILLLNVLVSIAVLIHHWPKHWLLLIWMVVISLALFFLAGFARSYALRVQDRVIRLEEKLRYQRLLSPDLLAASQALTLKQIIALRFASDAELPALVQRTLAENLVPKAIKQSISSWRPDYLRV
jgi:predicted lysophospholipase L1 biosynthesis ABC-type transport system permease subunit